MRFNPNCICDILLTAEENENMYYPGEYDLLDKYDEEEVIYHINQCYMADLIIKGNSYDNMCCIRDLTPQGHILLSKICSGPNWKKTFEHICTAGTVARSIYDILALFGLR